MSFQLTILGSGSALPTVNTHHSAHILNVCEQFYLIDCGEGAQGQMLKAGIHPLKVNAIFISHLHGDHVYGLFPLLSSLGMMGRRTPLKIFAPAPLEKLLEMYSTFFDEKLPFELQFQSVNTSEHRVIFENKVMQVWSIPLRHKLPCCGFHFREKEPARNIIKAKITEFDLSVAQIMQLKAGNDISDSEGRVLRNEDLTYVPYKARSFAYLSDTKYSAKAAGLIKGVDLLYHEATFMDKDKLLAGKTGHSTTTQAAKVATLAEAKKLVVGHISPRYKDRLEVLGEVKAHFENVVLGEELKTIKIICSND